LTSCRLVQTNKTQSLHQGNVCQVSHLTRYAVSIYIF
jgi:hypothetical protein